MSWFPTDVPDPNPTPRLYPELDLAPILEPRISGVFWSCYCCGRDLRQYKEEDVDRREHTRFDKDEDGSVQEVRYTLSFCYWCARAWPRSR